MSWHIPSCPDISLYITTRPDMSLYIPTCLDMSLYITTCLDMSLYITTCPDMSLYITTCPDMSGHFLIGQCSVRSGQGAIPSHCSHESSAWHEERVLPPQLYSARWRNLPKFKSLSRIRPEADSLLLRTWEAGCGGGLTRRWNNKKFAAFLSWKLWPLLEDLAAVREGKINCW